MKKNRSRRFGWAYTAAIIGAGLAALLLLAPACRSEKAPAGADAAAAVPAVKAAAPANVKTGLEVLLEKRLDLIKGKRIGLITNPSAVDRRLRSAIDLLREADGAKLAALYGPEHGVRGDAQAGEYVPYYIDKQYGLRHHPQGQEAGALDDQGHRCPAL